MKPHIEILLPVYNEVQGLPLLIQTLDRSLRALSKKAKITYCFIDDGSTDGSAELLAHYEDTRSDIKVISLIHNFGHGAAITCAIDSFDADVAVLMDADLQDNPEAIPLLFEKWEQGAKTVVAERKSRKEKTRFFFNLFYFLLHKLVPQFPTVNFGTFCLLDRSVILRIRQLKETNRYFPGLVTLASDRIVSVGVDRQKRHAGRSRVGALGLLQLALTAILSFSSAPIKLVSLLGLFCSGGALLAVTTIVSVKLLTSLAIPGWASTMTAISFFSGVQLLCTGIIGEYIARIYDEVKKRPPYLIQEKNSHENSLQKVAS